MKAKILKIARYLAAAIFFMALMVNVKLSLTDPFVTVGNEVIAQTTSSTGTGGQCGTKVSISGAGTICPNDPLRIEGLHHYSYSCWPLGSGMCTTGNAVYMHYCLSSPTLVYNNTNTSICPFH